MSVELEKEFISKISFKKRLFLGLMGLFVGILLLVLLIGLVLIFNSMILLLGLQVKEKIKFSTSDISFVKSKFISSSSVNISLPIGQIDEIYTVFDNSRHLSYLKFVTINKKTLSFALNAGFSNKERNDVLQFTEQYVQHFSNVKLIKETITRRVT